MSDDWVQTTLGDIAEWGAGGTPKAGNPKFYEGGSIPWAVIADVNDGYITNTEKCITEDGLSLIGHHAPEGAVLVTMYGTIGRVAITTRPMATNQAIAWAVPKEDLVSAEFLFQWLRNYRPELDKLARGATQRNINRAILRETKLALPPLFVQRRIVDLMTRFDALIANLQGERREAERLVESLSRTLLLPALDWVTVRLGDVAVCSWGNTSLTKKAYVNAGAMAFSASGPDGFVEHAEHEGSAVILSAIGAKCGGTWLADGKWTAIKNTIWYRAESPAVETTFLYWATRDSATFAKRGQAQPFIALGDVRGKEIPIPPVRRQREIAMLLSDADRMSTELRGEMARLSNLRSGLLDKLLSGSINLSTAYDDFVQVA